LSWETASRLLDEGGGVHRLSLPCHDYYCTVLYSTVHTSVEDAAALVLGDAVVFLRTELCDVKYALAEMTSWDGPEWDSVPFHGVSLSGTNVCAGQGGDRDCTALYVQYSTGETDTAAGRTGAHRTTTGYRTDEEG
jgi:hypothetical protein